MSMSKAVSCNEWSGPDCYLYYSKYILFHLQIRMKEELSLPSKYAQFKLFKPHWSSSSGLYCVCMCWKEGCGFVLKTKWIFQLKQLNQHNFSSTSSSCSKNLHLVTDCITNIPTHRYRHKCPSQAHKPNTPQHMTVNIFQHATYINWCISNIQSNLLT